MRKISTSLLLIVLIGSLSAQTTGGPDAYGYIWKSNTHTVSPPAYSWFDISTIGTPVTGLADDNFVGPFACTGFQYYWTPQTQFWIGSNGYISFAPQNIASPFPASVPLTSGANNFIAPMMADLNFTGTGNNAACYYYANADTICVSFINVPFWINNTAGYTGSNSFQVILNKVDKSITFNYLSTSLGTVTTLDNLVGMENNSGNLGLAARIDVLPTSLSTFKFYYPSTVTYAVTDGGMEWNMNNQNAGVFIEAMGDSLELIASVKNYGNQALAAFSVRDTIKNSSGVTLLTDLSTSSALAPGVSDSILFNNKFKAPAAGIYSFSAAVTGITGDMVSTNNWIQQKIVAINTTTNSMSLDYSDGVFDGNLGWNGGNGGVGIYVKPPIYPVKISGSRFNIASNNTSTVGFHAMIFDDDGAGGGPGTLLDSVFVAPSSIALNVYTTVPAANQNLIINSGGVYLLWLMDSAEIRINTDNTPPISGRTFEVLSGGWSPYRERLTEDFLMGLNITHIAPEAGFGIDFSQEPTLTFSDSSLYNPTTYLWNFGDGSTSSSTNPSHTYTMNGTYNVCLTVTNVAGNDSECKSVTISKCPPMSYFVYDATGAPSIIFTDSSFNSPTSWQWDFDDNGATSILQNPTHTYTANGKYNVCLTATNAFGTGATFCDSVEIINVGLQKTNEVFGKMDLFPNPNKGSFTLELKNIDSKAVKLSVYNSIGTLILQEEVEINQDFHKEINLIHQTQGIYYLEIITEKGEVYRQKVIIQ